MGPLLAVVSIQLWCSTLWSRSVVNLHNLVIQCLTSQVRAYKATNTHSPVRRSSQTNREKLCSVRMGCASRNAALLLTLDVNNSQGIGLDFTCDARWEDGEEV